jgi:hypothetical protein
MVDLFEVGFADGAIDKSGCLNGFDVGYIW